MLGEFREDLDDTEGTQCTPECESVSSKGDVLCSPIDMCARGNIVVFCETV